MVSPNPGELSMVDQPAGREVELVIKNEWAWTEPIYTSGIEDEEKRKEREEKKKRKEKKKKSSLDVLLSPPQAGHRASSPRAPSVSGAVGEVVNPLLLTTVD